MSSGATGSSRRGPGSEPSTRLRTRRVGCPGRLSGRPDQGDGRRDQGDGRRDQGVATVYACLGIVVLFALTGLAVHLGAATLARQRAETGADLSALAGAAKVLHGPDVACAAVVQVAVANGADVQSCTVSGTDVLVMVVARAGAGPFSGSASGRARAGPVNELS